MPRSCRSAGRRGILYQACFGQRPPGRALPPLDGGRRPPRFEPSLAAPKSQETCVEKHKQKSMLLAKGPSTEPQAALLSSRQRLTSLPKSQKSSGRTPDGWFRNLTAPTFTHIASAQTVPNFVPSGRLDRFICLLETEAASRINTSSPQFLQIWPSY